MLYRGVTQSPCGTASGATGPFYCPGDKKVYLDTAFFDTMAQQLGAKGDFAMAYVVAHEVGHHVQDELGILGKANEMRARVSEAESNVDFGADRVAGRLSGRDLGARGAQEQFGSIEPGDFEEAINAARQIGDDTLQRNAGRVPMPDSFTHGTSAQRSTLVADRAEVGPIVRLRHVQRQQSLNAGMVDAAVLARLNRAECPSGGMVDAEDSKSSAARHVGSSPTSGTNIAEKDP